MSVQVDTILAHNEPVPAAETRPSARWQPDEWTARAIESDDFESYCMGITHHWLRTLNILIFSLVPVFFLLDAVMMPPALLPRFALFRGASTIIALIQFFIVFKTVPTRWSYLHGYVASLQVGAMIVLMTRDLGGFSSSYYAGLNLVVIAVNLLIPWGARHTAANAFLVLCMYVGFNAGGYTDKDLRSVINNLYFMLGTLIIVTSINYLRFQLIKKEFSLLVLLAAARGAVQREKDIVEERNRSIKSLLDVSGQGFLSFDEEFRVSSEYSRACEGIFGGPIAGRRIDELLFAEPATRANFRNGLDLYFRGSVPPDVIFDLLEHQLSIGAKIVRIQYAAVHETRIMVVLTDITEEIRIAEASRRENEKWNMLRRVIANRRAFTAFNREASYAFRALAAGRQPDGTFLREIHTLKANAGFLGFVRTQAAAHALEEFLADQIILGEEIAVDGRIDGLRTAFKTEMAAVHDSLGSAWHSDVESIEFPRGDFLKILNHVKENCPHPALIHAMESHLRVPLTDLLAKFPQMALDLASRLGKRISPLVVAGPAIPVAADEFEELVESFTHLVRNMVDHGIELRAEREAKGKKPEGSLSITAKETDAGFEFIFADDGRGISEEDVLSKARQLGLIGEKETLTKSRMIQLIFRDDFSTKKTATEISGRGVGLPAVHQAVRRMGGRITVWTAKDAGTAITITIPRSSELQPGSSL